MVYYNLYIPKHWYTAILICWYIATFIWIENKEANRKILNINWAQHLDVSCLNSVYLLQLYACEQTTTAMSIVEVTGYNTLRILQFVRILLQVNKHWLRKIKTVQLHWGFDKPEDNVLDCYIYKFVLYIEILYNFYEWTVTYVTFISIAV